MKRGNYHSLPSDQGSSWPGMSRTQVLTGEMTEKILIVDDDLDTLRLVGMLLQRKGYQILAVDRGVAALEKASAENPDLILLDVMMPDMDGYEVLRRLRAGQETERIPIIMFTAKSQVDDKLAGFEAGADDYLTKPTHPAELLARVKTILARSSSSPPPARAAPEPKTRGKVAGVLSAKGGVGVSTVAVNLAATVQQGSGKDVIVADMRPGNGSLSLGLGYQNDPSYHSLLAKDTQAISLEAVRKYVSRHDSGLQVLPVSYRPSDDKYCRSTGQFAAIIERLIEMAPYIVLDLGPGLPATTQAAIDLCDQLIVVLDGSRNTVLQTKALLDELSLRAMEMGKLQVVLFNRTQDRSQMPPAQVRDMLGYSPAVVFTAASELAAESARMKTPMVTLQQNSLPNQQYHRLAQIYIRHGRSK